MENKTLTQVRRVIREALHHLDCPEGEELPSGTLHDLIDELEDAYPQCRIYWSPKWDCYLDRPVTEIMGVCK